MNILYVCAVDLSKQYAGTTHVLETVKALRSRGHRVYLVAMAGPAHAVHHDLPAEIVHDTILLRVPFIRVLRPLVSHIFLLAYVICVLIRHRIDVIFEREVSFGVGVRLPAVALRVPRVVEVNGLPGDEDNVAAPLRLRDKLRVAFQRLDLRMASAVIAVTGQMRELLVARYSLPKEKVAVISNGVNEILFRPRDIAQCRNELGLRDDVRYVGYIGSFYRYHAVDALVDAASLVIDSRPDVVFLLVGDGLERKSCEQKALDSRLSDHFIFTGAKSYSDIPKYICACDVCVFAYRPAYERHVSPLKLFEYLACGRPVLVAATRPDFIEIGATTRAGELFLDVDSLEPAAIARGLLSLLDAPPQAEEMGRRGREFVLKRHTWARATEKVEKVLATFLRPQKKKA